MLSPEQIEHQIRFMESTAKNDLIHGVYWPETAATLREYAEIVEAVAQHDAHDYLTGECQYCGKRVYLTDDRRQEHDWDCLYLRARKVRGYAE